MSPIGDQGADAEERSRAMSPASMRSVNSKPNGNGQPNINLSLRGKTPLRPTQEEGDEYDGDNSPGIITGARVMSPDQGRAGERVMSPEQGRAKSPSAFSSNRAISPVAHEVESYEPLSMASAVMGINGAARSASPAVVERGKSSMDDYYAPKASPTVNGFVNGKGSTGNITADLIRDLKEKEADIEQMKKREAWMKAALSKASRSGFIYADAEALDSDADDEDIDSRRVAEMVMNLKHVKAQLQVIVT